MTLPTRRLSLPAGLSVASVVLGGALLSACSTNTGVATITESKTDADDGAMFAAPVQLMAGGEAVKTPLPGYAAPAWHDVTGDGRPDLVVGQFKDGMIGVFAQNSDGSLAKRQWLQAEGSDAQVPGIW